MRVISGNIFQPIDYSSYLADMQAASKAHQELEDAYALIDTQASTLEKLKDSIIDQDVYNTYTAFDESLRAASDQLATQGLTGTSRRDLNKIRAQYAKSITPIEEAMKKREEEAKQQQDIYLKSNGKTRYSRSALDTKLSDYISNQVQPYSSFNLDDLSKEAAAAFKAYSDRNINTEEGRRFGNAYYDFVVTTGYDQNEASAMLTMARNNPEEFAKQFPDAANMINDLLSKYNLGSSSPYSENIRKEAMASIVEGANVGLGYDEKHDLKENKSYVTSGNTGRGNSNNVDDQIRINTTALGVSEGELPAHVKRATGLVPTNSGIGVSTEGFNKANANLAKAQAAIDQYTPEQLLKFKKYETSQKYSQIQAPYKDYNKYKREAQELEKAIEAVKVEGEFIRDLVNRYGHLKSNDESMYDAIKRGLDIDTATARSQDIGLNLSMSKANNDNLQFNLKQSLSLISEDQYKGKGAGTINVHKRGKDSKIDYDDFKSLIHNEDSRIIPITDKGQIKFGIVDPNTDELYILDNMSSVSALDTSQMNKYYKEVNDFSSNTFKQNVVSPSEYINILNGRIPEYLKANEDGTYTLTIANPEGEFTYERAIVTNRGELITSQSLNEALSDNSRATKDLVRYGVNKLFGNAVSANTNITQQSPLQ